MLAYANREALERTFSTGDAYYYSRSRKALWRKGQSSGHQQKVTELRLDCDGDTVLYRVEQSGPACHTGGATCFNTVVMPNGQTSTQPDSEAGRLPRLSATIAQRAKERPASSYTVSLLDQGTGTISQKVAEEAIEVVVAANTEGADRLASEAADLFYHLLVLLHARGVPLDAVWKELEAREK